MSLPGKNFRTQVLNAFNVWLRIDERSLQVIDRVVGMLHNASLLYVLELAILVLREELSFSGSMTFRTARS